MALQPLAKSDTAIVNLIVAGDNMEEQNRLLTNYCEAKFDSTARAPMTFDTRNKVVTVDVGDNQQSISLNLSNISGVEEYEKLCKLAYKDANVVLLTFSIIDPNSLSNATARLSHVQKYCPNARVILVGIDSELRYHSPEKCMDSARIAEDAAKHPLINASMECSAKAGIGVNEVFEKAANLFISQPEHISGKSFIGGIVSSCKHMLFKSANQQTQIQQVIKNEEPPVTEIDEKGVPLVNLKKELS